MRQVRWGQPTRKSVLPGSVVSGSSLVRVFASVLVGALVLSPAAALAGDQEPRPAASEEGVFLGERYRWAHLNLVTRVLHDVVAIPGNVPRWQPDDWAQFALWTSAVGTLMFAGEPSPDVRFDRWTYRHLNGPLPELWTFRNEAVLWATLGAAGVATWGWAAATGRIEVAQGVSLMAEALAVAQIYHLSLKLALGREGPEDGEGNARILGPANALRVYPSGTPSGHSATFYSALSAAFAYFRPPAWLQVIVHAFAAGAIAFHVIEHKHFASDSLWGAVMGWYVGQWVVKHRASWVHAERRATPVVMVAPFAGSGVAGLALQGAF
jgi:hypothetical protein